MDFFATAKLALTTLLSRKMRSALAVLGIVIGVTGVIVIMALGEGAQSLILGQVTKLGSNLLSVQPGKSDESGPPAQVFGITITTLVNEDAEALRDKRRVPHATALTAIVQGSVSVSWQNKSVDTNVQGLDYQYPEVMNFDVAQGYFFTQQEEEGNANVVVLGSSVAESLFADSGVDPVGQVVKLRSAKQVEAGGVPVRVIGVIAPRGSTFFQDNDDQVFVPLLIAQQQLLGQHWVNFINIKVDAAENLERTREDVRAVMNQRHKILRDVDADYTVRNLADAIAILTTITDALRLFLTSIAAIALVVGGIGILNIMLAAVAERTREVGLRKALGATNAAVRYQFLLESGMLTAFGGLLGIALGTALAYLISIVVTYLGYDWQFLVSLQSIALALGVSISTGIIFGLYPAFKAAALNPIEALRYE